jgi:curli biogenesis system outer membrane secretion channel CsgG
MNRFWIALLLPALLAGCQSRSTTKRDEDVSLKSRQARPLDSRPILAVVEFGDESKYGEGNLGTQALRICETELSKSRQVVLVERKSIDRVITEQKFQNSGMTEAATAAQLGKLVNARFIISGAVTNFGVYNEGHKVMGGLYSDKTTFAKCEVDAKLIDVQRGVIVTAWNGNGEATKGVNSTIFAGATTSFDQTLGGRALRAAVIKMLDQMLDEIP